MRGSASPGGRIAMRAALERFRELRLPAPEPPLHYRGMMALRGRTELRLAI
jgi:hypothetical protein